jgi:hypothetical protein
VVLVLTMDGCVTAFSLACVDRDQYAHPLVHAPLPLPPLPAAAAGPSAAAGTSPSPLRLTPAVRGLHVCRESLGFVHRSRALFRRPVPNP